MADNSFAGDRTYLNLKISYGSLTDIDGNVYPTAVIGGQTRMAANLKVTRYRDDSEIPHVADNEEWAALQSGGWAHYEHNESLDSIYGRLYNWYAVNTDKLCPEG